jgi:glutaredoxin-like protein
MTFLKDKDREYVRNLFKNLTDPVELVFFTQELECQYCRETHQILEELTDLSDKLSLVTYNFQVDNEVAQKYGVDKIPATVLMGKKDYGIKYYGVPSGYEFASLLEDIVDVSGNDSGLSEEARELLKQVTEPLHLQVFVTPTCPYCPKAVRLAHKLALENDNITADMVEATEFPHLAMRYNVSGVPRTVIGEDFPVEGAAPEMMLVEKVVEAFNAQKES